MPMNVYLQFIALQTSAQPEEVEIFVRKPQDESLAVRSGSLVDNASTDSSIGLKILEGGESLGTLYASYSEDKGELVRFLYWCISNLFLFFILFLSMTHPFFPGFGLLSENSEVEKLSITCSFDLDDAKEVKYIAPIHIRISNHLFLSRVGKSRSLSG